MEALLQILGEERLSRLMEYSAKLKRKPEVILREVLDMNLLGEEELNLCQNLRQSN